MKYALSLTTVLIIFISCKSPTPNAKPMADTTASTQAAAKTVDSPAAKHTDTIPPHDTLEVPTPAKWARSWTYKGAFNNGQLDISSGKKNFIDFHLYVEDGGHSGEVSGRAKLDGRSAYYRHPEVTDHKDTCKLDFTWEGDSVVVSQEQGNCEAGVGVYYSGTYYKNPPVHEGSLINSEELTTPEQEKKFKQLVGPDYKLFVNSSQLVFDATDEDSLGATVRSGAIRGEFTEKQNIILINKHMDIWAAVIVEDSVYYFTNRPDYAHRLPRTIEDWREHFKEKPIIFK